MLYLEPNLTEQDIKRYLKYVQYKKLKETDLKAKVKYTTMFTVKSDEWEHIYTLPFTILADNKVMDLQYRVLHRYIGTNKLLYKIGKRNSPNCEFCIMYPETIEHIFFECIVVKNFWFEVFRHYSKYTNQNVTIECRDILLYYKNDKNDDAKCCIMINLLILYGKMYVYKCKMENIEPQMLSFLTYMTFKLTIFEQVTCKYKEEYLQLLDFIKS